MFSTDANQVQSLMFFSGMVVVAPLQIAVALGLIYQQVGNATWVGLGFMIILIPLNAGIFISMSKLRKLKSVITDSRVKMMNEILAGKYIINNYISIFLLFCISKNQNIIILILCIYTDRYKNNKILCLGSCIFTKS